MKTTLYIIYFILGCLGLILAFNNGHYQGFQEKAEGWCVGTNNHYVECGKPVETKVISILKEQKDCKAQGGEFRIKGDWSKNTIENSFYSRIGVPPYDFYTLTCTNPAKELWKYEVE